VVQIVAALVAVLSGNCIQVVSNPNIFSSDPYWDLGALSIPVTVLWIVAITNAVNLIDGLDGLACGVSTISSMTMLVVALLVSEGDVAVMMAALAGACIGFLPYNLNPAKIFMGDTGATFLGYILATVSVQGMFKLPTIISFVVPFLMLGLPIFDVTFAVIRRLAKGQSPMSPDRSHIHHRLIDMGFSQKQAVGILYVVSAILGLSAVVLTTTSALKAMVFLVAMAVAGLVAAKLYQSAHETDQPEEDAQPEEQGRDQAEGETEARHE
jgi:UDP-GlcNAc:undecaprenyl-phosphate GlcNAc-1-phosphate transferase